MTYAIIQTGGKQYKVSEGQKLVVEKLPNEAGKSMNFDQVLLVDQDGKVKIGTPTVSGAKVEAMVTEHGRGKKLDILKYRAKVRYRKKTGHRQAQTTITITKISA
jgi:large subunit ribosomal protein L21